MCLLDTVDGALMLTLYHLPASMAKTTADGFPNGRVLDDGPPASGPALSAAPEGARHAGDPITFLYYSIVLTALTVAIALIIGVIQLLTLVLNVAEPEGPFWDGVQTAGDYYDVIGGGICGSSLVVGGVSVLAYKPWRRRMERTRGREGQNGD